MDLIKTIDSVFKSSSKIDFSEGLEFVESEFFVNGNELPDHELIISLLNSTAQRDTMSITLMSNTDSYLIINQDSSRDLEAYTDFLQSNNDEDDQIKVRVKIEKSHINSIVSVYDFDTFSLELLEKNLEEVLGKFNKILRENDYFKFELLNSNIQFCTRTLLFANENISMNQTIDRQKKLRKCKEAAYFLNYSQYQLLPDDFLIEISMKNNPLERIFDKMCNMLSLIYISTSSLIDGDAFQGQINGQRNLEFHYNFNEDFSNPIFYSIYDWIYTDGNPVDKAIIARNIISLHCRFSSILELDGKTYSSIQSNFNLYLKENAADYIELKNKLSVFIDETVTRISDYTLSIFAAFKSNIAAVCGFFITVFLVNLASAQPLNNIFTKDITRITEIILLGSFLYMIISICELSHRIENVKKGYKALKSNYEGILSKADIDNSFDNDKLLNEQMKRVKNSIVLFSAIWTIALLVGILYIEYASEEPLFNIFRTTKDALEQISHYSV